MLLRDMADACRSPRGRATTRREGGLLRQVAYTPVRHLNFERLSMPAASTGFCTPTKTVDERCVAILFLAHDGVANPEIWERWRDSQPVSLSTSMT